MTSSSAASADRFRGGDRFILDAPQGVPAVWGSGHDVAWAKGEALWVVGPPGVGKTTIAGQIARCLMGLQDELLGMEIESVEGCVLYLALDRPRQIARALRRSFSEEDRDELAVRFEAWAGPLPFDIAQDPDELAAFAARRGAGAVIVDSAKDAALDLSKDETGSRFNRAMQSVTAAGIEVLVLHHQRKASATNMKPSKLADVYGSAWLTAGAGSVLLLWGEPGDPLVELRTLKPAVGEIGPLLIEHDHQRGTSRVHERPDLLELVNASPGGVTVAEAAISRYGPDPTRADRERARRRLRLLEAEGKVEIKPASDPTRFLSVTPRDHERAPHTAPDTADHEPLTDAARNGSRPVTQATHHATPLPLKRGRGRDGEIGS